MYGVMVRAADAAPSVDTLEQAVEDVAAANCIWVLTEWMQGREPPCCLDCGAVKYRPDRPGSTTEIVGAPEMLKDKRASCHSAAAYVCGYARAEAMRDGMTQEAAAWTYRVVLIPQPRDDARDGYWHAVVMTPDGLVDVTEEMQR